MSDKDLRELERAAIDGDSLARGRYYAERIRRCAHDQGTTLAMVGGIWGRGESWCKLCGACISSPELDPRPEGADANRKFAEDVDREARRINAMTPEEHAEWEEALRQALANIPERDNHQGPFRRGLTYFG